jgi:hypothetical protein
MCEVSKMPATSLFTPSMEHLAQIVPAMQEEMSKAEQFVQTLAQTGGSFVNSKGNVGSWLEDDDVECFFEIAMSKCAAFQDVEAIASKIHVGGVVLVLLYYDYTFYVYLENGEEEQPLLDTNFPDVSLQKEGVQLKTYRNGVRGCDELRRTRTKKTLQPSTASLLATRGRSEPIPRRRTGARRTSSRQQIQTPRWRGTCSHASRRCLTTWPP